MYKALLSFTTIKSYHDVQKGEILASDFDTPEEIQKYLDIGYIEEYSGSLDITANGTYDVTDYEQAVVNVGGGGGDYNATIDMSRWSSSYQTVPNLITKIDYIDTSNVTTFQNFLQGFVRLEEVPKNLDTSNGTIFTSMFNGCAELETIPQLDTSKATDMKQMFYGCTKLKNIPVLNTSKVTMMGSLIAYGTAVLTDESINNILIMCINATAYTQTKTLAFLGFTSAKYPSSRIQALPKYQDFINAGWTIGY